MISRFMEHGWRCTDTVLVLAIRTEESSPCLEKKGGRPDRDIEKSRAEHSSVSVSTVQLPITSWKHILLKSAAARSRWPPGRARRRARRERERWIGHRSGHGCACEGERPIARHGWSAAWTMHAAAQQQHRWSVDQRENGPGRDGFARLLESYTWQLFSSYLWKSSPF